MDEGSGVVTGEVCHICAELAGGPRYDASLAEKERNNHRNLILLCSKHHKIIDRYPETYTVETLRRIKARHESRLRKTAVGVTAESIQRVAGSHLARVVGEDVAGLKLTSSEPTLPEGKRHPPPGPSLQARDETYRRSSLPSAREAPVRILHLSDLHFRKDSRWDADPVLRGLTEAIAELVESGLAPDFVAITGDIAFSGQTGDYREARKWIDGQMLGALPDAFPRAHILMVPGNHDVDRGSVRQAAQSLQKVLLERASQEAIADVLRDPEEREVLLKRHKHYLQFANGYRAERSRLDVPWWSQEFSDKKIRFAGLCSSWMSWSGEDQGRLLIGQYQASDALFGAKHPRVLVALVHHPWAYLKEFDATRIETAMRMEAKAGVKVVLRGHLHHQQGRIISDPDASYLELGAGCAYQDSEYPNGFQLVEVFPSSGIIMVHLWTWREGRWTPDRTAYDSAPNGIAVFGLGANQTGTRTVPTARDRPRETCEPESAVTPAGAGRDMGHTSLSDQERKLEAVFRVAARSRMSVRCILSPGNEDIIALAESNGSIGGADPR